MDVKESMIYISGKVSLLVMSVLYGSLGIMLLTRRDMVHRVKIFHGQAYIDCSVDGDNDPNTCVSDFTVEKTFNFNAGYSFGGSLLISSLMSLGQAFFHKPHMYSTFSYLDSLFGTSLMTFSVAVVTGGQGMSTLILMILNTAMYETGIYLHDKGFWDGQAGDTYNYRGRYLLLVTLNFITLSVNIAALIEYWSVSHIPTFIPMVGVAWFIHFIMMRYFTFRYFYATLPTIIKKSKKEERSMFKTDDKGVTRYYVISKEDPFAVDWLDSWKGGINLFFKLFVALIFYVGTNTIKITYK